MRGAPLHAGCNADPSGILDQQDIIDVIGKQLVKGSQGDPAAICKGLTIWSSLQRLPCSEDVFKHACEHLGFWGADAREKAIYWATAPIATQGPYTHADYIAGVEPDWKRVFEKLCLCVRRDRGEDGKSLGLLCRWANVLRAQSSSPNADAACAMVAEMNDHARYGFLPDGPHKYSIQPPHSVCSRRWYELLSMGMFGPERRNVVMRVSPAGKIHLMSQQVNRALANANGRSLILPLPVQDAFNNAFGSGFFTPNMYVQRGNRLSHILPQDITVDVAAFAMPSGLCKDIEFEGDTVPNVILDAVLSHPVYDPRKCVNKACWGGVYPYDPLEHLTQWEWKGSITLLGLYLALFHERGAAYVDPVIVTKKSGKQATLRRILEHPLQDLRQKSDGAGLVHMCLSQTIRCPSNTGQRISFLIADGVRAWSWRHQALMLLWEKTCDEHVENRCIWLCTDDEGRTPRALFEHKWAIFRRQVLKLLAPALRSKDAGSQNQSSMTRASALKIVKHMDNTAYNPLKELFIVAERG